MEQQLHRLDTLINQLLEVGRLDAVGHDEEPEELPLLPLLQQCARSACTRHQCSLENVFRFEGRPVVVNARPIVLEMIFGNLLDNAIKYGGQ
ncbi:uncharacterized protein METZ01_LOCUS435139, partial [marine metagenome]